MRYGSLNLYLLFQDIRTDEHTVPSWLASLYSQIEAGVSKNRSFMILGKNQIVRLLLAGRESLLIDSRPGARSLLLWSAPKKRKKVQNVLQLLRKDR